MFKLTFKMEEQISDLETDATHDADSNWKTLFAMTSDASGSNATGKYRMAIRNAPSGDWTVTCEGFDATKPAKTVKAQFPAGPDPVHPLPNKQTIDRWPPQPISFKFKLVKSGTGAGRVIVPA
jgi:hypothetical protein